MTKVDHPPAATAENNAGLRRRIAQLRAAGDRAFENGRDVMAADIAVTMRLMQNAGMTDTEMVDGIAAIVTGHLALGLPAGEWFE